MQNPISKLRQNFIISEKPGYLSEKLKTLMDSNYHRVYFFIEILHTFHTSQCQGCSGFVLFCLDLELLKM